MWAWEVDMVGRVEGVEFEKSGDCLQVPWVSAEVR